jgi:hypothetical protein
VPDEAADVHLVLPRRKAGQLDTPEREAVVVTPEILSSLFQHPLAVASQKLVGLPPSTRISRSLADESPFCPTATLFLAHKDVQALHTKQRVPRMTHMRRRTSRGSHSMPNPPKRSHSGGAWGASIAVSSVESGWHCCLLTLGLLRVVAGFERDDD